MADFQTELRSTGGVLTKGAPGAIPADMSYWLGQKYAIEGKSAEGAYQRNIGEAGLRTQQAIGESKLNQFLDNPDAVDFIHDKLLQRGALPMMGGGAPPAQQAPAPTSSGPGALDYFKNLLGTSIAPVAPIAPAPARAQPTQSPLPSLLRSPNPNTNQQLFSPSLRGRLSDFNLNTPLDPNQPVLPMKPFSGLSGFRKGTANVKAPPDKGGKAGKAGGMPKGLEALLPMLLAAQQGGQGGAPPAPGGLPGGPPAGPPAGPPSGAGLRKGSANVTGKGGKGGKASKGGGGGGLEAILPALMAASQAGQMGGGAVGPQAAPGNVPPMTPGAAAPPGFAQGVVNVRRYADGTSDVSINDAMPPGFAYGAPDVQPNPGYPFGAGYLFGATAVPGQGSGTVDTVNAKLAPHEAVLNRAAADMMGRGKIAALNAAGVRQMGLGRGVR